MRRIVIKVGTHVLTEKGLISKERIGSLVELIHDITMNGNEVILVSSGAVGAGFTKLKLDKSFIPNRQALAAIGQPLLLKMYQAKFAKYEMLCSQVLLTASDLDSRKRTTHAKNAIDVLLSHGVVPIINENDVTATEELVFGDNDRLSAHVTHYFDADILVILSDIDGYYDRDPRVFKDAKIRLMVNSLTQAELETPVSPNNEFATGGIVTKLLSADFLMNHNKAMFLSSGFDLSNVRSFLIDNIHISGTHFKALS